MATVKIKPCLLGKRILKSWMVYSLRYPQLAVCIYQQSEKDRMYSKALRDQNIYFCEKILQVRQAIKHQAVFDVYPNLIISITTANTIAQQIHYIINKELTGIFHLTSNDLVHHQDLFTEICEKISNKTPIFKSIYNSNDDQYLAILPKHNILPTNYQTTVADVVENSTLEDLITLKNQ